MTDSPLISPRMPLPCGHVLAFHSCGAPGEGLDLAHQKDDVVSESYNQFLPRTRRRWQPERVLEIGVCRGGSLALWHHLWGCQVIGIDNNLGQVTQRCLDHYQEQNIPIQLKGMTMPDPEVKQLGMFDLIIDDGGHGPKAVFPAFVLCWPMVTPGGIYVIEDWHHDFLEPKELLWYVGEKALHDQEVVGVHAHRAAIFIEKRA